jgi:hypothetical protein
VVGGAQVESRRTGSLDGSDSVRVGDALGRGVRSGGKEEDTGDCDRDDSDELEDAPDALRATSLVHLEPGGGPHEVSEPLFSKKREG